MKLTEEQIKKLEEDLERNRTETEYICDECEKRIIGLDGISKHVQEKKHYGYRIPGVPGMNIGVL